MRLSTPLRVVWDWDWPPVVRLDSLARGRGGRENLHIAEELARSRVLLLEIGYPSSVDVSDGLLLEVLGRVAAQTSLVLTPEVAAGLPAVNPLEAAGLGEIWLDVTPADGKEADPASLPCRRDGSPWPALRIHLTAGNRRAAAVLVTAAAERGTRTFSLPILPLFGRFLASAERSLPSWNDLAAFAGTLEPLLRRFPDLDLRVHYQSLWALLGAMGHRAKADEAPGHDGCQAASALAYIDPAGILYPCASLPIPLGRVTEGSIGRLWGNREVRSLRQAIAETPVGCEGCDEWHECRGGCRGWAHFLSGRWKEPGPDCSREPNRPRPRR